MPILKILPDAVSNTANYTFGTVTANSFIVSNGIEIVTSVVANNVVTATQSVVLNDIMLLVLRHKRSWQLKFKSSAFNRQRLYQLDVDACSLSR